jgi:ketosteroid isomerase-like protein
MSEENLETLRRSLEAFDRRDRDAWFAFCDQDYEVIPIADWPETDIRGRDAAWDFYVEVLGAFQQSRVSEDTELLDAGPDKVLVHYRGDLRGRESGADVGFDYWLVSTEARIPLAWVAGFHQGKVSRLQSYENATEALEAAGLRE